MLPIEETLVMIDIHVNSMDWLTYEISTEIKINNCSIGSNPCHECRDILIV